MHVCVGSKSPKVNIMQFLKTGKQKGMETMAGLCSSSFLIQDQKNLAINEREGTVISYLIAKGSEKAANERSISIPMQSNAGSWPFMPRVLISEQMWPKLMASDGFAASCYYDLAFVQD